MRGSGGTLEGIPAANVLKRPQTIHFPWPQCSHLFSGGKGRFHLPQRPSNSQKTRILSQGSDLSPELQGTAIGPLPCSCPLFT